MTYSPPLPLVYLPPPLNDSTHRPPSVRSQSSKSTTLTQVKHPPSAYHRRSRSFELLGSISVLAPASNREPNQGLSVCAIGAQKGAVAVLEVRRLSEMTNMATGSQPTPQPKKPGFFRRMSLSSSSSQNKPIVKGSTNSNGQGNGINSHGRSVSGFSSRQDVLAGPSYESLPAGAAPSAFVRRDEPGGHHMNQARFGSAAQCESLNLGRAIIAKHFSAPSRPQPPQPVHRTPSTTPIAAAFTTNKSPQSQHAESTPARSRHPIHPALASPPKAAPRRMSASSPYDSINPKAESSGGKGRVEQAMGNTSYTNHHDPPHRSQNGHYVEQSVPPVIRHHHSNPPSSALSHPANTQTGRPPPTPPFSKPDVRNRPEHAIPPIPSNTRQNSTPRPVPARDPSARYSRFDDADASNPTTLPEGAQASVYTRNKPLETKGLVSARRSTSSSRRTPNAKVETRARPITVGEADRRPSDGAKTLETLQINDAPKSPPIKKTTEGQQAPLSEAGAYAKAIAATIGTHRSDQISRERPDTPPSAATPPRSKSARPLPAPPVNERNAKTSPKANFVVIASSPKPSGASPKQSLKVKTSFPGMQQDNASKIHPTDAASTPPVQNKRASLQPLNFDFPRSPTLPPLIDPRANKADPIAQWGKGVASPALQHGRTPLSSSQLPPRLSSTNSRRAVSSPLASPAIGSGSQTQAPHAIQSPTSTSTQISRAQSHPQVRSSPRERPRATITFLLLHNPIQAALLSHLSINSFLSLTGSSDLLRKRFTGEMVGRWVMKEWGVQVDREKGRSWPNLTVWEGFLESLLHDPATYSTYPSQWYNLLQHLSLSHTLIVLHLRQLPITVFPNSPPLPFEDESNNAPPNLSSLPFSNSYNSLGSQRPRSRLGSAAGSDAGSLTPATKMPRQERLVEIVMPEPLGSQEPKDDEPKSFPMAQRVRRRGSIGSIASAASFSFGRRRSASINTEMQPDSFSLSPAAPMPSGKAALPPVSYPSAKRYGFKRHGEPSRSRKSSESSRPGSIFSVQSTPSFSPHQRVSSVYSGQPSFAVDRHAPPVPGFPAGLPMLPPIGGGHRSSFASSDSGGRLGRRSDQGGNSPVSGVMLSRRDLNTPPPSRPEPCFDRPIPFTVGRAPILRVFVPLSDRVQRWPSAEGAAAATKELEKCGALRRMKLGDIIVNTAIRQPKTTEHVLVYVPFVRHLLIPLDYTFSPTGNLPSYVNGFDIPPSYYYPLLPTPQILFLDLAPFAQRALRSIRLAYDRRDVTVASGARLSAKRYLHVAGFEVLPEDRVASEWQGMISLEAEGTAEGKLDIESRLVGVNGARPVVGPWELVREKSMMGTIWLRLIKQV
ncbi:hypothetical protein I302_102720 [Kwoniella bestiolae CBS 10118]|uniref:Uncharacterized protein n=1 Tax=Kwoniella bestiolae CBS 10118 TaxID=1296100 RepID=A0A1B9GFR6_9TREE|nr:hypothetical protein I302_01413 [Kwoniella bestiolae CBS 10118]OCF29900.1 hypothetical protein I302_01413 [Kwoniella bestiolae CBS 10118]